MSDKRTVKSQVRIPVDLHERIVAALESTGRSMNAEIVQRLEASFLHEADLEQIRLAVESERQHVKMVGTALKPSIELLGTKLTEMMEQQRIERELIRALSSALLESQSTPVLARNAVQNLLNYGKANEPPIAAEKEDKPVIEP